MNKNNKSPIFYGYVVVAASFMILILMHGLHSSYGVFFRPLQDEFGWDRATISGANSLCMLMMGVFAMVSGRLTDRFGPKITVMACGFILGLAYFLVSRTNSIWQLHLFYGVLVGIGNSSGDVSLLSTTARWFVRRRSMMSGVVKVGTGVGQIVVPLIASWYILNQGWRNSFMVLGLASMGGIVLIAQLLRRDPAEKGLQPDGVPRGQTRTSDSLEDVGLSLREAMRKRQFWLICSTLFVMWYCTSSMMLHTVPHALDLGFSAPRAASMISTIGAASIAGRLIMGNSGDRMGNRKALGLCFLIMVIALSWLFAVRQLWELYLFAAVYGFAHGGFFSLGSPLVAELFGVKSHGAIFGTVLCISQIGAAIGPVATGRIFDVTGSYSLAFSILITLGIIGLLLSTRLKPFRSRV